MSTQPTQTRPGGGTKRVRLVLSAREHHYGDVHSYHFRADEPLPYNAGQYVHVALELADPDAKRVRELSFSSAPHEEHVSFTIDGRSRSPFQLHMLAMQPGDSLQLFKSKMHMLWPVIEECVVFIAGGVGVTPFRSMALDKQHSGVRMRMELIHAAGSEHLFAGVLQPLMDEYIATDRAGLAGEISTCIERNPDARYYIAGSPGFVEGVMQQLEAGGISPKKIETDEFKGYEENWTGE
ncbi:MAG: hypothetical protein R3F46_15600 [bacterium]